MSPVEEHRYHLNITPYLDNEQGIKEVNQRQHLKSAKKQNDPNLKISSISPYIYLQNKFWTIKWL